MASFGTATVRGDFGKRRTAHDAHFLDQRCQRPVPQSMMIDDPSIGYLKVLRDYAWKS